MPRIVYLCLAASALACAALLVVPADGEQAQPLTLTAEALPASSVAPPTTTTTPAPTTVTVSRKPTVTTTDTKPRPPRQAPRAATPARPGPCAGWETLIAAHFPAEVGKACSVLWCESKGDFAAKNRRSSASGGWQFLDSTWRSVTGRSDRAYQASPEVQTAAAAKLRARSGWGQWVCR